MLNKISKYLSTYFSKEDLRDIVWTFLVACSVGLVFIVMMLRAVGAF